MRKPRCAKVEMSDEARVLREMRLAKGLTMRGAATLIGKSDSYISQIENGRMIPPRNRNLELLLNAYGPINKKSFYDRVRSFKTKIDPKEELIDLIYRLSDKSIGTAKAVITSLL